MMRGPIRPSRTLPSEPGFAYHATNEERACDIARTGLKPHRPWYGTDQRVWPDGSTEKRSYHSSQASTVASFAPEDGAPVILRTPIRAHLFRRESVTGDLYSRSAINPRHIAIATEEAGWVPLQIWCGVAKR